MINPPSRGLMESLFLSSNQRMGVIEMVRFAAHLLPQMPVDQCVRIGKMCEDAGFDMLFIADEAPGFPFRDPFIVWAQIFAMTKKIKIGKTAPRKTTAIVAPRPTPNQTTSKGIMAIRGMV